VQLPIYHKSAIPFRMMCSVRGGELTYISNQRAKAPPTGSLAGDGHGVRSVNRLGKINNFPAGPDRDARLSSIHMDMAGC
jgi:hypothetical protein